MAGLLKFLFVGDIVGDPGLAMFTKWAPRLKEKHRLDGIIVNGENSARNGMGITPHAVEALRAAGADVITTGNHALDSVDVYGLLDQAPYLLRPINYPAAIPGHGYHIFTVANENVAVVNLHGRVFVREVVDCPFKAIESLLTFLTHRAKIIFVDFHAEATSEKRIMGMFLDGQISGIYGTHTHTQSADEIIQPKGTSFITDLGYSGAVHSILGMEYEGAFKKMVIHHKLGKFSVEHTGPFVLSGVITTVDTQTGKSVAIERVRVVDHDLIVEKTKGK